MPTRRSGPHLVPRRDTLFWHVVPTYLLRSEMVKASVVAALSACYRLWVVLVISELHLGLTPFRSKTTQRVKIRLHLSTSNVWFGMSLSIYFSRQLRHIPTQDLNFVVEIMSYNSSFPLCSYCPLTMKSSKFPLGNDTGNPGVFPGLPVPVPAFMGTGFHGYGFRVWWVLQVKKTHR